MRKPPNFRVWYDRIRKALRRLRHMCVSLLTIALAIAKVIEAVAKVYADWFV